MTDPLSVAASIAAVLTLAEQVISTTVRYFRCLRDRECVFKTLVKEITMLQVVLDGVGDLPGRLQNNPVRARAVSSLIMQLEHCKNEIIRPLIEHLTRSIAQGSFPRCKLTKLLWPLDETETKRYLERLERWKATFNFAIQEIEMNLNLSIGEVQREEIKNQRNEREEQRREREAAQQHRQDEKFNKVQNLLFKVDPSTIHKQHSEVCHPATGRWIFDNPEFQTWQQTNNSLLWISGIPGAGKSVLISTIINDLERNLPPDHGFAYFYCVHNDLDRSDPTKVLSTIVAQLCKQNGDFYYRVKDIIKSNQDVAPDLRELKDVLIAGSQDFAQITLVIDALDECEGGNPSRNRSKFFNFLRRLGSQATRAVKVLATSRPEPDIRKVFLGAPSIVVEGTEVDKDIELYLCSELDGLVSDGELKLGETEPGKLRKDIISALMHRANGMYDLLLVLLCGGWFNRSPPFGESHMWFLFVKCQLEYLCNAISVDQIVMALEELPKDLTTTYVHILLSLDRQNDISGRGDWGRKIIRFVAGALRPMKLDELAELISIEEGQEELRRTAVATDSDDLTKLCGSLVRINWETKEISLAHFSVKEFLLSETILDTPVRHHYVGTSDVNAQLAKLSLTYLLFKDFANGPQIDGKYIRLGKYKFLEYAATYGGAHLRMVSEYREDIMKLINQLFVPPTNIGSYTNDSELRTLLSHMTFSCNYNPGLELPRRREYNPVTTLPISSFHLEKMDTDLSNSKRHTLEKVLFNVLSATDANTADKRNMLSWLQVYMPSIHWKEHPANITPLYFCSLMGWKAGVAEILKTTYSGASIGCSDLNHALRAAAIKGWTDIVELLLDAGADIHAFTRDYGTALSAAKWSGCTSAIPTLIRRGAHSKGRGILSPSIDFEPSPYPLAGTIAEGDERLTTFLMKGIGKTDINNTLTRASSINAAQDPIFYMFRVLIDDKADSVTQGGSVLIYVDGHMQDSLGNSASTLRQRYDLYGDALQAAALGDSCRKVKGLLEKGADPNAPGGQYGCALQAAAIRGDPDVVRYLLKYRADPNEPAKPIWRSGGPGASTLEYHGKLVVFSESTGFKGLCARQAFFGPLMRSAIAVLVSPGIDGTALLENEPTNQYNHYGNPLQAACVGGSVEVVNLLLESGVEVNKNGGMYGNALQAAAVKGHTEVVKLLLTKGACPNQRGGCYQNPLQGAATSGNWEIADLLVHAGADRGILDEHGWTAAICALHCHDLILFPGLSEREQVTPLRPSSWSGIFKSPKLELLRGGLEVRYLGHADYLRNLGASARADHPVPPDIPCYYFEVEVIAIGANKEVGVGICSELTPLYRLLGMDDQSYGYHGDKGIIFSDGKPVIDAAEYGAGDIVGCGVVWSESECFFTLNGLRLENTVKIEKGKLYPTVCIRSEGGHVRVNFGQKRFVYDVQSLGMYGTLSQQ